MSTVLAGLMVFMVVGLVLYRLGGRLAPGARDEELNANLMPVARIWCRTESSFRTGAFFGLPCSLS